MKGIIIYEDFTTEFKSVVNCGRLSPACYTCRGSVNDVPEASVSGGLLETTTAICSGDDKYDFETGALIALMKMCGVDKVKKAAKETFFDVAENSVNEYEEEIKKLREEIVELDYIKTCNGTTIELLYNTINTLSGIDDKYKELKEENENLKSDCDKYFKEVENLVIKKNELIEENEKLKLDCEKLQHGYIDTDMIFCGGRQNGKQYTLLVDLFKKIDQKKVDAAYKEAYNTKLPLWQKEVLNQMYGVYKESKGETELPRTLDINGVKYRKMLQIKDFGKEIRIKPPTKREQMWNDILACDCEHSKYVKVKKEDLEMFAKECNEKKIFSIAGYEFHLQEFWFADDRCIFQIFRKPAGFICAKSVGFASENSIIDYLPPMRWDLFKKGRIVVKANDNNYEDFYNKCEVEIGRKPFDKYTGTFTVYYKYEKELEQYIFHTRPYKDTIPYAKKIVDWEDVR